MDSSKQNESDECLKDIFKPVASHNNAMWRFGAQLAILCKFVDAVFPELTDVQCKRVVPLFRKGIEDAMASTDDMAVPAVYQEALLEQANVLLAALELKGRAQII
jgi:hypothetical protein